MRGLILGLAMGWTMAAGAQSTQAGEMAAHGATGAKSAERSTSLVVSANGKTTTFSMTDLAAMPQRTVTVHNGHSNVDEQYAGVAVSDLLGKFGVTLLNGGAKQVYHSYLRATGTDGYFVLYSDSEVEGPMHTGDVIVATAQDGKPLGTDGDFKLVSSEDKRPARWVRNLKSIAMVTVE